MLWLAVSVESLDQMPTRVRGTALMRHQHTLTLHLCNDKSYLADKKDYARPMVICSKREDAVSRFQHCTSMKDVSVEDTNKHLYLNVIFKIIVVGKKLSMEKARRGSISGRLQYSATNQA